MTSTTDINAEAATLPTLDSNSSEPPVTDARAPDRAASSAGHQLGRYRVLRVLGQGSAGVVHTAYDQILDRVVALKTVRTDRSTSTGVGRFIREAKALARLSHPNIVHIYDVSTSGGQVFLAMEFIRGRTLRQHLADHGGAPCSDIVALFVAAGQGLAAVHRAGLVHRDFKPDNVMVGDDGRVRVLDFGLVRDAQSDPSQEAGGRAVFDVDLTTTGCVLGTPAYMAPEQHRGGEADARSDVFSFCASLYEALYGERPFVADSYEALRAAMLEGTVRPPTQSRVPAWLRDVVLRGLRADPAARWQAMEPLLAALAADLGARRRRWLRRIGLVSAIAGLTLVGTLATLQLRRAGSRSGSKPWRPSTSPASRPSRSPSEPTRRSPPSSRIPRTEGPARSRRPGSTGAIADAPRAGATRRSPTTPAPTPRRPRARTRARRCDGSPASTSAAGTPRRSRRSSRPCPPSSTIPRRPTSASPRPCAAATCRRPTASPKRRRPGSVRCSACSRRACRRASARALRSPCPRAGRGAPRSSTTGATSSCSSTPGCVPAPAGAPTRGSISSRATHRGRSRSTATRAGCST
ncbi:protein kinase [Nannocystis pusilla]|uniref:Protein kinase n=1 Tax=Nannocystis pusilla TaxID=889268 RepID=A0A9X3F119_9BACT|nr:serine/threonine-protein kinase [Nannocystis pusilla]MCY1009366.1 protein kinase [Nannocystis pusilla]